MRIRLGVHVAAEATRFSISGQQSVGLSTASVDTQTSGQQGSMRFRPGGDRLPSRLTAVAGTPGCSSACQPAWRRTGGCPPGLESPGGMRSAFP